MSERYNVMENNIGTVRRRPLPLTGNGSGGEKRKCHYCRAKTLTTDYVTCRDFSGCNKVFCCSCLKKHFGVSVRRESAPQWQCPVCTRLCNCSKCRGPGYKKTNMRAAAAKKHKFKKKLREEREYKKGTRPKLGKRREEVESDEESGSVYIPAAERQKKKKEFVVRESPARLRQSAAKRELQEAKRPRKIRAHEAERKPSHHNTQEALGVSSPSTILPQQSYPKIFNREAHVQYIPCQVPCLLPGMPQGYGAFLNQSFYPSFTYPVFTSPVNSDSLLRDRIHPNFLEGYARGNIYPRTLYNP